MIGRSVAEVTAGLLTKAQWEALASSHGTRWQTYPHSKLRRLGLLARKMAPYSVAALTDLGREVLALRGGR